MLIFVMPLMICQNILFELIFDVFEQIVIICILFIKFSVFFLFSYVFLSLIFLLFFQNLFFIISQIKRKIFQL